MIAQLINKAKGKKNTLGNRSNWGLFSTKMQKPYVLASERYALIFS